VLTGKYNSGTGDGRLKTHGEGTPEQHLRIAAEVMAIAGELGATPAQVALSWVRQAPGIVIPLIGARTVAQLDDNLGALKVVLTPEQRDRLDKVSATPTPWPQGSLGKFTPPTLRNHRALEH
jgi:aryl-alcohol dehydrogenase-like predicted oxidoreductase